MPTVSATVAALALAGVGNTALLAAAVAPAAEGASNLAPWLQGGGSAAAVAGLVYVARLIVKGDLVPRPVADRENETNATIAAAARREQEQMELLGESMARETTLANLQAETLRALARNEEWARQAVAEMTWWRERRGDRT